MAGNSLRIGFVASRLSGTDGVSLESAKWCHVLTELGHECFYFTGQSDRAAERSFIVPEAHFEHPLVRKTNGDLFDFDVVRTAETTESVHDLRVTLKKMLHEFIDKFDIQLLKIENALSLPMNVPLGLALTELIAETNIPTIAHHHDFYWERARYAVNAAEDYLQAAFPPSMPTICHVVINSYAATALARRTGLRSTLVPNVIDFDNPPPPRPDNLREEICQALEMSSDEAFLLQPTRVVPRKCIERSIELACWLDMPATLVISHASGDEGDGYKDYLIRLAHSMGVRLVLAGDVFSNMPGEQTGKVFSLADAYQCADLVTYPSRVEGFGNAFLEAIYYRRPIVIGGYEIFRSDIEPKGFRVISMDGFLSNQAVNQARAVLHDKSLVKEMTELNYRLGRKHYSHSVLRRHIQLLIEQRFGAMNERD